MAAMPIYQTLIKKRATLRIVITILSSTIAIACGNYDLLQKLENPHSGNAPQKRGPLRIFVTQATYTGTQIGGLTGADTKCNTDANTPASTTGFKAMLALSGNRIACTTANCSGGAAENINWVMTPNTTYYRRDGVTQIATTNAAGIWPAPFTLTSTIDTAFFQVWTGLTMTAGSEWLENAANACTSWTSDGGTNGTIGSSNALDANSIYNSTQTCNQLRNFYCVEQ